MSQVDVNAVKEYLLNLQDEICNALAEEDGSKTFMEDSWDRNDDTSTTLKGGGRSRVMEEGKVFEKAGIPTCMVIPCRVQPLRIARS